MSSNTRQLTNIFAVNVNSRIIQINVYREGNGWIAGSEGIRGFKRSGIGAYDAAKQFALHVGTDDRPMEVKLAPAQPPPREPTDFEKFVDLLHAFEEAHANSVRNIVLTKADHASDTLEQRTVSLVNNVKDLIDKNKELQSEVKSLKYQLSNYQCRLGAD